MPTILQKSIKTNKLNINGKKLEITKEFFSKLENQIKSEPRLWLWSHKRWKHTN